MTALDLTEWSDPGDTPSPERTLLIDFTADGAARQMHLFPDTDRSTWWAEAASAVVNSETDETVESVTLDPEASTVHMYRTDGSVRSILVQGWWV